MQRNKVSILLSVITMFLTKSCHPAVAILNPKRPDDSYPFKELCGCGVGFKFMQAFAKNNNIPFSRLVPLLDFCAVSIAADLVPVTDENRILAFHG